jgi:hypothetical protein
LNLSPKDWSQSGLSGRIRESQQGIELAEKVFARPRSQWPDGVVITDDSMTRGALLALQRMGVALNRDIKIATYSNRGSAVLHGYEKDLTRIEFDAQELTEALFTMLEHLISKEVVAEAKIKVKPCVRFPKPLVGINCFPKEIAMRRSLNRFTTLPRTRLCASAMALAVFALGNSARAQAADYVWLEGEAPSSINVTPSSDGVARPEFLSGGKWLHINLDSSAVEKNAPEDGVTLSYKFNLAAGGKHNVWNRIGYEGSRTGFQWRLDGGEWTDVASDVLTTDLVELSFWTDVEWLKLTERELSAGAHTLEIRLPRQKDDKGATKNIQYASDAILVTPDKFHPNGRYKPDENYRDARDEEATKNVFELPEPKDSSTRSSVNSMACGK